MGAGVVNWGLVPAAAEARCRLTRWVSCSELSDMFCQWFIGCLLLALTRWKLMEGALDLRSIATTL